MRDLLYFLQLAVESVVGVVGIRLYEEPPYAVVGEPRGAFEVRRYAPRLAAEAEVPAPGQAGRNEAFQLLFRYIAGANAGSQRVEKAGPVVVSGEAEKIAMTVPVRIAPGGKPAMQFFLPGRYAADTAPRPLDPRVRLVMVPERTVAVLRFSGSIDDARLAQCRTELLRQVREAGWRPAGEPEEMFYDAPFTLPFLKRNEVAVQVEPSPPAARP